MPSFLQKFRKMLFVNSVSLSERVESMIYGNQSIRCTVLVIKKTKETIYGDKNIRTLQKMKVVQK